MIVQRIKKLEKQIKPLKSLRAKVKDTDGQLNEFGKKLVSLFIRYGMPKELIIKILDIPETSHSNDKIYDFYYTELIYICNIEPCDSINSCYGESTNYLEAHKKFKNIIENRTNYLDPHTEPSAYTSNVPNWDIAQYILVGIYLKGAKINEDTPPPHNRDILDYETPMAW